MTDLTDLIARVEKLEGLDAQTMIDVARRVLPEEAYPGGWLLDKELADWRFLTFEKFVGVGAWESAALALVERCHPAAMPEIWQGSDGDWGAHFRRPPTDSEYASTPALALILALLRALEGSQKASVA